MPLRTPHRRISPRTKRRYRAIKDFFKKTIGNVSQTDYRTRSSIVVSVSDLKSKINILEQHLDKVSKHCRDLSFLEQSLRKGDSTSSHEIKQVTSNKPITESRTQEKETKILYETPRRSYVESESLLINKCNENIMNANKNSRRINNKEYIERPFNINEKYKHQSKYPKQTSPLKTKPENKLYVDQFNRVYSTISLQSPREKYKNDETCDSRYQHRRHRKEIENLTLRENRDVDKLRHDNKRDTEHRKTRKKSHRHSKVDEHFIADIIRKQYKPVKLFGRRLSDYSQFSAPVCRDQEFTIRDEIIGGGELCSCCFEGNQKDRQRHCEQYNLSDMRSICDARLYTAKKQRRYKQSHINNYNDSNLYDLVPVKEKSSPKSRRKFIEENYKRHERFREVLPSPRTNRPRLNLKAQRYAYDDMILPDGPAKPFRKELPLDMSDESSDVSHNHQNLSKGPKQPQAGGTMDGLQYSNIEPEQMDTNNDTMRTQVTCSTVDKTDKALCEIKDILQSFLQEIKRESIHSHSEFSSKSIKQSQTKVNDQCDFNTPPKNHHPSCSNNNTAAPCVTPMVSSFNPCCYPILPICPINYSPNSFMVSSPSYTCATCTHNCQEAASHDNKVINTLTPPCQNETQELIKEIYKCVARNNNTPHAKRVSNVSVRHASVEKKILTSRSVGSSKASKHDAMVETPKMKSYSKSCEAIGSRMTSDTCYSTNPTSSETVIEKLNLETSRSSSETEMNRLCEAKKNKFARVFNRFGLFKRKKKDAIEEVSESESTVEVDVMPHNRSPYKQQILNYNVHAQEFLHRLPKARCCTHDSLHKCACGDDGVYQDYPYDICKHRHHSQGHSTPQCCQLPNAPLCCHNSHNHTAPQIPQLPLCLKEIEVKSIGTQSDRKLSIFPRFKKKVQSPLMQLQQHNTITTQTPKERNILLNWEKLKQKAANVSSNSDPIKFSMKTQKELALGDTKMRNAMLKKLFYKRNPFSPRNLIIRTLLGKDKSSWGDPPRMYKPRMFI